MTFARQSETNFWLNFVLNFIPLDFEPSEVLTFIP